MLPYLASATAVKAAMAAAAAKTTFAPPIALLNKIEAPNYGSLLLILVQTFSLRLFRDVPKFSCMWLLSVFICIVTVLADKNWQKMIRTRCMKCPMQFMLDKLHYVCWALVWAKMF